jgi:hypothetical protein
MNCLPLGWCFSFERTPSRDCFVFAPFRDCRFGFTFLLAVLLIVPIRIGMIILRFIPVPSVSLRSSSRLNALAHCIMCRPESFGPVVDRLLELQKQNPAVSIESLLDQHGAGDPELRSLRKFLESLTPNMQRQDQLDWELVSRSPLPREPYAPNSLLVLHLAFHCSLDTQCLFVFCISVLFSRFPRISYYYVQGVGSARKHLHFGWFAPSWGVCRQDRAVIFVAPAQACSEHILASSPLGQVGLD